MKTKPISHCCKAPVDVSNTTTDGQGRLKELRSSCSKCHRLCHVINKPEKMKKDESFFGKWDKFIQEYDFFGDKPKKEREKVVRTLKYHLRVYNTGKKHEWYLRIWMGEKKSHGLPISDFFRTKKEAEQFRNELAKYMSYLILPE